MYKLYPDQFHTKPGKLIEIKPIQQLNEQQVDQTLSLGDEIKLVQQELEEAKKELQAIKQRKDYLLKDAIREINNEKQKWELEKQNLKESVKEEGFNKGIELGKQESLSKYNDILQEANSIIQSATKDYNQTLAESEQTIVQLAVHIAEKILNASIVDQSDAFINIVKAAIKKIKDQSIISIYLHPKNYNTVMKQKDVLKTIINGDTKISIYVDQGLNENSCLIEHPLGRVDASVDTQLLEIQKVLMEIAKENKS